MPCLEELPGGSLFRIKRTRQHGLGFPKLPMNKPQDVWNTSYQL